MIGRRSFPFANVSLGWFLIIAVLPSLNGWAQNTRPAKTQSPITDLAFAPDAECLVGTSQAGVQVFDWPELNRQRTFSVSFSNVHCLAFSPDGTRLAVGGGNPSESGGVDIFSWPDGELDVSLSHHSDSVMSVAWDGNTHLVSASLDRSTVRWDLKKDRPSVTYRGHSSGVKSVCLLQEGVLVTAGHDHSVRVWDSESGRLIRTLNQHARPVHAMAVNPYSAGKPMVATAAADRSIRFWQPTIGRMVRYIRLESEPLDIAWIDDSRIVASCTDGKIRVVDANRVKVLETIPVIKGWAYAIAVRKQDQDMATAGSQGRPYSVDTRK